MKVAVAVLSYNRLVLWERTVASLRRTHLPFDLVLYDNGSSDGTERRVAELSGICNTSGNHWIGHGFREATKAALSYEPELVVFSADDYEYRSWWLDRLVAFWEAAPENVALCSLAISEQFRWNAITGTVEYGGQRALVRQAVPGASWTFRSSLWPLIEPHIPDDAHSYDKRIGTRLRKQGYLLCEVPMAAHIGRDQRSWMGSRYPSGLAVNLKEWGWTF